MATRREAARGRGRREAKPTQSAIARKVGVDVSCVNKILNRKPGAAFRKETVRAVFRAARELGYDLGKLKFGHQRRHPRRDVDLPVEITIYLEDGGLFDRGKATLRNVSLSGALLGGLILPEGSIPVRPHVIGIRLLDGPLCEVEILGRPVRFASDTVGFALGVEFLKTQAADLRLLAKIG